MTIDCLHLGNKERMRALSIAWLRVSKVSRVGSVVDVVSYETRQDGHISDRLQRSLFTRCDKLKHVGPLQGGC